MLPKRTCAEHGCRNVAALGSARCELHTQSIRSASQRIADEQRGSSAERGYDAHHERLRVLCFERDGWRCRGCGWEPDVVRECRLAGIEAPPFEVVLEELRQAKNAGGRHLHADHIVPISGREDPRRLDLDNMQTLCDTCHRRKTLKDNGLRTAARMAAPGPDR
jgi:5-methylcytosine-specific restriction endonuclease McrA